jgi:ABC-2 type transport system ATP-binding protein
VIHEPELLFLDEPTSAVDPESRRDFWEKLFELADTGSTILVSTHLMDEAERCHHLVILDHGKLVADGTPGELMERLAGRTLVVHAEQPRRVQRGLLDIPGVISVAQVGNTLRVLTADSADAELRLRDALSQRNLQADIEPVLPNLEDVFVAATRNDDETDRSRHERAA